jgi:hypothetical protein
MGSSSSQEQDDSTGPKNKPEDSDFKQQRLKAWQPILTPMWVIITFASVGIIFMIIGILVLIASGEVVEKTSNEYQSLLPVSGNQASCVQGEKSSPNSCVVQIGMTVEDDMDAPVYMYYQLSNFYQNHRRYVKSRSDTQLRNDDITKTAGCDPLAERTCPGAGTDAAAGTGSAACSVYPCGLIAWSVFNDTFYMPSAAIPSSVGADTVYQVNNCAGSTSPSATWTTSVTCPHSTSCVQVQRAAKQGTCDFDYIPWTPDGIAWSSDKTKKFKTISPADATTTDKAKKDPTGPKVCGTSASCIAMPYDNYKYFLCSDPTYSAALNNLDSCPLSARYADVGNEEFIVWMRTSGLPDFRKLHRIINMDLKKGDTVYFYVNNIFPVSAFDGKKKIVLSTTTWIGGKNQFLGWAYIVVAILCILLAIGFGIKHMFFPRQVGKASEAQGDGDGDGS